MIIKRRNSDLYYISRDPDLGGRYLDPYVPNNTFFPSSWTTKNLSGKSIKRIPVYPGITEALMSEGIGKGDLTGMTFYIYKVPHEKLEVHDVSENEVPGSSVTGEKWIIPYNTPRLIHYKTIVVTGKSGVHNISWGPSQRLSIQEYRYRWSEQGSQTRRTSKIYIPWTKSDVSIIKPGLRRIQVFKTESEARNSGLGDYIYRPTEKVPVIDASGKLWIDTDVKVK